MPCEDAAQTPELELELVAYPALHGIEAGATAFAPGSGKVGAVLLAPVADMGADVLAMGAYARSCFRRLLLGAVTGHMITDAAPPVLMARRRPARVPDGP